MPWPAAAGGDATARGQALRSSALACLAAAHGLAPGLVEARIERGKDGGVLLDALRGDAAAVQVDPAGRDGPAPDFYANLTGSPIAFRTVKELEGELVAIDADLRKDSADQWKDRLEALRSLGQILAGGCVRSSRTSAAPSSLPCAGCPSRSSCSTCARRSPGRRAASRLP